MNVFLHISRVGGLDRRRLVCRLDQDGLACGDDLHDCGHVAVVPVDSPFFRDETACPAHKESNEVGPADPADGGGGMDFVLGVSRQAGDDILRLSPEKIQGGGLPLSRLVIRDPDPGVFRQAEDVAVEEGDLGLGFALGAQDVADIERITELRVAGLADGGDVHISLDGGDLSYRSGDACAGQCRENQQNTNNLRKSLHN